MNYSEAQAAISRNRGVTWGQIEKIISEFSDEELADLKAEAIRKADDGLQSFLLKCNPRTSRLLQVRIHNLLKPMFVGRV